MSFSILATLVLGAGLAAFVTSFIRLTSGIVGADPRYVCRNPFKYERFLRDLCVNLCFAAVSTAAVGSASSGHFFDFDNPLLIMFLGIIGALMAAWILEEGTEPFEKPIPKRIIFALVFVGLVFTYAASTAIFRSAPQHAVSKPTATSQTNQAT